MTDTMSAAESSTHRAVALAVYHDKVVTDASVDLVLVIGHGGAGADGSSLGGGEYRTYLGGLV